ncbi:non-homologous end-joining factor 1 isoform X2 [Anomaloglossus baeobatrachus]|uniref:non-homologous end-joining factor 1 isoform X2 n=1 Tax=Anomaloglossus baeobatrachus TaxID=238106 RepID=UPI003F503D50
MALSPHMDRTLLQLPWQMLHIADCSFFVKVHFTDSSYCFLVSDLSSVWCEEAAAGVIEERSKELNKRLKAPISSFLSHLSQFICPLLDSKEKTPNTISCTRTPDALLLHVKSQLSGLPFYWDFHCREADVSTVCRQFLQPLLSMTKALDSQCQELCTLLRRKDEEIQDYQEGGAVLSRDRLRTETFEEDAFYKTLMSKNIPEQRGSSGLSERLQQLYRDVVVVQSQQEAAGDGVRPLKEESHEGDGHVSAASDPSTAQQEVDDGPKQKPSEVPPDDALSLTQRPSIVVAKAKKRKAKGLFT